ncbi:hypothetical protein [Sporosarcina obsidiansis]|uniref:hypothetical protein n=1 Tax=Sporosarcina obsidiansis TaxID=2660748 RepID=UPI00129AB531|nr:hypothetical protein [Sporosarcina obsidiansis]
MKKYTVSLNLKNGTNFSFETDMDVKTIQPIYINGAQMVVTETASYNVLQVNNIEVVENQLLQ